MHLVIARAASRSADGSNTLDQAIYTACKICEDGEGSPTWALRARRAKQNAETQMISYQDAVLEVKGVPILYVPYFAHPDPSSKRRSGLLAPEPGLSSKLGAFYIQPYYLALSESQDLTIIPHLHTNVAPLLELEYRKRFYSGYVEVETSLVYDEEFNSDGDPLVFDQNGFVVRDPSTAIGPLRESEESLRSHIFAEGLFDINETWKWGFGLERASDDLYLRRYDFDDINARRGLYESQALRLLSQVYAVGSDRDLLCRCRSHRRTGQSVRRPRRDLRPDHACGVCRKALRSRGRYPRRECFDRSDQPGCWR